jgi:protein NEDD1
LKRKQKLKTLSGHADAIAAVQYSPGDTHVASAGREGVVVLHSPVSGLVVGTMVTPGTCCAFPKSRHRPFAQQG